GEIGRPGGVHIVPGDQLTDEDRVRLRCLAAFRLDGSHLPLREQVVGARDAPDAIPSTVPGAGRTSTMEPRGPGPGEASTDGSPGLPAVSLEVPSPFGGFDAEGGEYVIELP